MRVSLLFEYPTLYGGERSMLAAVDSLRGTDLDLTAIAPPTGRLANAIRRRNITHEPLQLFDEDGRRRTREEVSQQVDRVIQATNPDLLHANSLSMSVLAGTLETGVPRTGHIRDIISLSKNAVRLLNQNNCLAAVSQATRDHHISQGVDPDRIRVIYNGVHPDFHAAARRPGDIRTELALPDNALIALTAGQIGLRKGLDVLVRAIREVAAKDTRLHFVIAGTRSSGKVESIEYERRLHEDTTAAGLDHRVHWLGYRDDMPALLGSADLLIHAAHQEPLGRVLLEAASLGLPIVATDVGGTREILPDDRMARLVPAGDAKRLGTAVLELAGNDSLRQQLGAAAQERARSMFTAEQAASNLMALWESQVGQRGL